MPLNPRIADWHGRHVWLIGASTGIGAALASQLHAAGAQVTVSARNSAQLAAFTAAHPGSLALTLDVTDALAVTQAVAQAMSPIGAHHPPDCVVYCAGHFHAMRADATDLSDWLRHDDVNYRGVLHVLAALLPQWLQKPATLPRHISLIGSVAGYRGLPNSLAYGPTKAALINLAEALYTDLRPHKIGVSLINPGFVETPLTAHNAFPMPAMISPAQAAAAILKGWARGDFELHFPRRFTVWLKLLRLLPYRWYFGITQRLESPS